MQTIRLPRLTSVAAGLAIIGLSGCAAVTSTTNRALDATSAGLESTTDASITEPEGYRYASARAYVASQMPMIRREAATGHGENIRALAALMGEPDARAFGEWMQNNYARLFTGLDKPEQLVARISRYRHPDTDG